MALICLLNSKQVFEFRTVLDVKSISFAISNRSRMSNAEKSDGMSSHPKFRDSGVSQWIKGNRSLCKKCRTEFFNKNISIHLFVSTLLNARRWLNFRCYHLFPIFCFVLVSHYLCILTSRDTNYENFISAVGRKQKTESKQHIPLSMNWTTLNCVKVRPFYFGNTANVNPARDTCLFENVRLALQSRSRYIYYSSKHIFLEIFYYMQVPTTYTFNSIQYAGHSYSFCFLLLWNNHPNR